jgi:uncharacterized protein YqeY
MLQEQLTAQLKDAMRARDTLRTSVIRSMLAAFTNELVAKGRKPQGTLADDEAIAVIRRLAKQRTESIEQFKRGNRPDLADKEAAEFAMLETYLPAQMDEEAIMRIIETKKAELGVASPADKGKLMGAVMQAVKGQADGNRVRELVEQTLNDK